MVLPLAPVAGIALRYAVVALATYGVTRSIGVARRDQGAEEALDELAEGLAARRDPGQANVTGRWRRVIRVGQSGPGVEIDIAGFSRIRVRRL